MLPLSCSFSGFSGVGRRILTVFVVSRTEEDSDGHQFFISTSDLVSYSVWPPPAKLKGKDFYDPNDPYRNPVVHGCN